MIKRTLVRRTQAWSGSIPNSISLEKSSSCPSFSLLPTPILFGPEIVLLKFWVRFLMSSSCKLAESWFFSDGERPLCFFDFLPLEIVERAGPGIAAVDEILTGVDVRRGMDFWLLFWETCRWPSDLSSAKTESWSLLTNRFLVCSTFSSESTDGFWAVPKSKFFSEDSKIISYKNIFYAWRRTVLEKWTKLD